MDLQNYTEDRRELMPDLPLIVEDENEVDIEKENIKVDGCIKILNVIKETTTVLCCKYTDDFRSFAVGLSDGKVSLYKVDTGKLIKTLKDKDTIGSAVTQITHRPVEKDGTGSNSILCAYSSGLVKCWDLSSKECRYTIREKRQILGLEYHTSLNKFLTLGDDGLLYYYDEETKKIQQTFSPSSNTKFVDGHTSRVFSANFHPVQENEFISGGWDNVVLFWDARHKHASRHLSGVHISADGLKINPTGHQIFTCAFNKKSPLELWDYASMRRIFQLEPDVFKSKMYCGKYININYAISGGGDINIFRVIDMKKGLTVGYLKGLATGVYSVDVGQVNISKRKNKNVASLEDFISTSNIVFTSGNNIYEMGYIREVTGP